MSTTCYKCAKTLKNIEKEKYLYCPKCRSVTPNYDFDLKYNEEWKEKEFKTFERKIALKAEKSLNKIIKKEGGFMKKRIKEEFATKVDKFMTEQGLQDEDKRKVLSCLYTTIAKRTPKKKKEKKEEK